MRVRKVNKWMWNSQGKVGRRCWREDRTRRETWTWKRRKNECWRGIVQNYKGSRIFDDFFTGIYSRYGELETQACSWKRGKSEHRGKIGEIARRERIAETFVAKFRSRSERCWQWRSNSVCWGRNTFICGRNGIQLRVGLWWRSFSRGPISEATSD